MTEAVIVIVLDKDLLMAAQCHLTSAADNLSQVAVNSVTNKCTNNFFLSSTYERTSPNASIAAF